RSQFRGREAFLQLLMSPLIVPAIVIGASLYMSFVEFEVLTGLPVVGSVWGLAVGHILITIPWSMRLITANLIGVDRSVEEAALSLGASPLVAALKVTLPLIWPGMVAAALFSFVVSFGNLEISLLLVTPGQTTLRMIAGFTDASAGAVRIRERDVTQEPPYRRNIGVVFQNYALFPHLTVFENVAFGLRRRRASESEIVERVDRALSLVKLDPLAQRLPRQLSGGQQQRVAVARALVIEPDVLLLDEPLSNLDRHLRDQLRGELRSLQRQTGVTAVLVTHDQEEALSVSDLVGVTAAGRVLQVGPPAEVYARPRTPFVARFLGAANLPDGKAPGLRAAVVMVRPERCVGDPGA